MTDRSLKGRATQRRLEHQYKPPMGLWQMMTCCSWSACSTVDEGSRWRDRWKAPLGLGPADMLLELDDTLLEPLALDGIYVPLIG